MLILLPLKVACIALRGFWVAMVSSISCSSSLVAPASSMARLNMCLVVRTWETIQNRVLERPLSPLTVGCISNRREYEHPILNGPQPCQFLKAAGISRKTLPHHGLFSFPERVCEPFTAALTINRMISARVVCSNSPSKFSHMLFARSNCWVSSRLE